MVRRLFFAALFCALAYFAFPWVSLGVYAWRLSSMPAPAALAMPVAGLEPRVLRDTWNAVRGADRRHEGIDIFAEQGTPVIAATEGIVLRLGENALGGKVVWVYGPGGMHHYYAHLKGFSSIRPGQRVVQGTPLGFVGNTGNARTTPPHLHYGVYGPNGAINPFPLLAPARQPAPPKLRRHSAA